ncbi:TenA family protein [Phaeovibrio sulfidiphilus]|uniref:TenA family protein n=1 Tax=Phaeovibrio sulfidiphilus TaxID=1220600 RepID=A0A8J6YP33_9PROT|nr:TenA family protein [Phaeovibrio sulfidiphilus]MBE1236956.1 TenA family protein [Phaeovibrio sulfidiphilus]
MHRYKGDAVPGLSGSDTLFARLRTACKPEWDSYVRHVFVSSLGEGVLPESCFQQYLKQDYLFLIHFARAYALATYKSETLDSMRDSASAMAVILDEMKLHVKLCQRWGITEKQLQSLPEARATLAYTRYVLERGVSGDILDLHVALSPCIIGYAEIGLSLQPSVHPDHPYREWIETYCSDGFVGAAKEAVARLDRLMEERGGPGRMPGLIRTFREATLLEADFWQAGLDGH